jgi:hypothetical protein
LDVKLIPLTLKAVRNVNQGFILKKVNVLVVPMAVISVNPHPSAQNAPVSSTQLKVGFVNVKSLTI